MFRSPRIPLFLGYVIMIGLLGWGLLRAQNWATASLSDAVARGDWQRFRDDVVKMNSDSPVRRRIPKSKEPPALVLMRDHFTVCAVISVVLSSALYGTFALFVIGSLNRPHDDPSSARC